MFYGDRYNIDLNKVTLITHAELRKNMAEASESTALIALYDDKKVEAGPRARLSIFRGFRNTSLYGIHEARVKDTDISLVRLLELLVELYPGEPYRTKQIRFGPGKGVGVYEAPRGTLINIISLGDEGRVNYSKIIVPTHFNIPLMEEATIGLTTKAAETVIRLYDPCIPCAVHVVKLDGGSK